MKAITDKIIEMLENRAQKESDINIRSEIDMIIVEIKNIEKEAEFEEIARVMMKHLGQGEKYHPHYSVIITNATAELVEGVKSVGAIMDYVPD
jgi:hypothetical protein